MLQAYNCGPRVNSSVRPSLIQDLPNNIETESLIIVTVFGINTRPNLLKPYKSSMNETQGH